MVKYNKLVVVNDGIVRIFAEIAEQLSTIMRPYFEETIVERKPIADKEAIHIVLNPHHYPDRGAYGLHIGWDFTNSGSIYEYRNRNYGKMNVIAVDTWEKQFLLESRHVEYVPYSNEMVPKPKEAEKDIDVALIGDCRLQARKRVIEQCRERGLSVATTEDHIYGIERDEMIARSKVMIDIPRAPRFLFLPSVRERMAVVNKCILISSGKYIGLKPYVLYAAEKDMIDTIEQVLSDDEQRQYHIDLALREAQKENTSEGFLRIIRAFLGD